MNVLSSFDKDQLHTGGGWRVDRHALTKIVVQQKLRHRLHLLDFCCLMESNDVDQQKSSVNAFLKKDRLEKEIS